MTPELLRRTFREIGAGLVITGWEPDRGSFFRIEVGRTHNREQFEIRMAGASIEIPDVDANLRQLLLLAGWGDAGGRAVENRYLCGFDERHWFAAGIPETPNAVVRTVAGAHEALKPLCTDVAGNSSSAGPVAQQAREPGLRQAGGVVLHSPA